MTTWDGRHRAPSTDLALTLAGEVCTGEVGAIFCIEDSRLARNGREWHYLLDLCSMTGTLIIDPRGIYDPRLSNDRLMMGLDGTRWDSMGLDGGRWRSSNSACFASAPRPLFWRRQSEVSCVFPLPVGVCWTDETSLPTPGPCSARSCAPGVNRRSRRSFRELRSCARPAPPRPVAGAPDGRGR